MKNKKIIYILLILIITMSGSFMMITSNIDKKVEVGQNPLFYLDSGKVHQKWKETWYRKTGPPIEHWFIKYKSAITGNEVKKIVTFNTFNSSPEKLVVYFYNKKSIYELAENISFIFILFGTFSLVFIFLFIEFAIPEL